MACGKCQETAEMMYRVVVYDASQVSLSEAVRTRGNPRVSVCADCLPSYFDWFRAEGVDGFALRQVAGGVGE